MDPLVSQWHFQGVAAVEEYNSDLKKLIEKHDAYVNTLSEWKKMVKQLLVDRRDRKLKIINKKMKNLSHNSAIIVPPPIMASQSVSQSTLNTNRYK